MDEDRGYGPGAAEMATAWLQLPGDWLPLPRCTWGATTHSSCSQVVDLSQQEQTNFSISSTHGPSRSPAKKKTPARENCPHSSIPYQNTTRHVLLIDWTMSCSPNCQATEKCLFFMVSLTRKSLQLQLSCIQEC